MSDMKTSFNYKSRALTGIAFIFIIFSITNSCSKPMDNTAGTDTGGNGGPTGPGTNEVWIKDMAYNPASITITAGTAIKWINKDGIVHTVTSDDGLFDSGSMVNGATFSHTFNTPGTFQYYCTVHPTMTGKVIVN